jgi:hypothetical protein
VPALLELQQALCAQLLREAPPLDDASRARLSIYRDTRIATLVNALRLSFPAVQRLVGAEFFEAAAREFIRAYPPASACLDDYGAGFAGFLRTFPPASGLAYLGDVAQLEWAVNLALHADDVAGLDLARLARLQQPTLSRLSFRAHPALTLLRLQFPVDAIWRAVLQRDQAAMAAIDLGEGPVHLMVERDTAGVQVHRLNPARWQFSARLCAGTPLYELVSEDALIGEAALPERRPDADTAAWLAEHLALGRLVDFHLSVRPAGATCE